MRNPIYQRTEFTFILTPKEPITLSIGDVCLFRLPILNEEKLVIETYNPIKGVCYDGCNCEAEILGFVEIGSNNDDVVIIAQPVGESVNFAGTNLRPFRAKQFCKLIQTEKNTRKKGAVDYYFKQNKNRTMATLEIDTSTPEFPKHLLYYNQVLNDNTDCGCR